MVFVINVPYRLRLNVNFFISLADIALFHRVDANISLLSKLLPSIAKPNLESRAINPGDDGLLTANTFKMAANQT